MKFVLGAWLAKSQNIHWFVVQKPCSAEFPDGHAKSVTDGGTPKNNISQFGLALVTR